MKKPLLLWLALLPIVSLAQVSPPIIATGSTKGRTVQDRFSDVANVMDYGAFCDTFYTQQGDTNTITSVATSTTVTVNKVVPGNFLGATFGLSGAGTAGLPFRSTFAAVDGVSTTFTSTDPAVTSQTGALGRFWYGHDDQPAYLLAKASGSHLIQWPSNKFACGIRGTLTVDNARPVTIDFGNTPIVALTSLGGSAMLKTPATGGTFWRPIGSQVRNGILEGMGVANYIIEHAASVEWHFHHLELLDAATHNIYVHGTSLNGDFSDIGIYNEAYTVPFPGATGYGIEVATGATDNHFRNIKGGGGANPSGFTSGGIDDNTFGTFYTNIHFYSVHNGPSFAFNTGAAHIQNLYADMGASQPNQQGFSFTGGYSVASNLFCYASGTYAGQICVDVHSNAHNQINGIVCEGIDTVANCVVGGGSTNNIGPATGGTDMAPNVISPQIIGVYASTFTAANHFCPLGFGTCQNGSTKVAWIAPANGILTDLYCSTPTAPGGVDVFTGTITTNNVASNVACTITGASKTCKVGTDTGDQFSITGHKAGVQAGQEVFLDFTTTTAGNGTAYCGVIFTQHAP